MEEKERIEVDILEGEEETKKEKKKKHEAELEALKEANEKLVQEKAELNNKYLVTLADYQNYKKRLDEEQERFYKYANSGICKDIINILDNFDLVLDKKSDDEAFKAYLEGFKMTRNQLYSVLEKNGVKEMESVLGKEFDPETMESLAQVTDPSKKDQEVTAVYKKGYYFKDRVLRHAQVIVNVLPVENTENKEE